MLFITLLAVIVPKLSGGLEKLSVIIASLTFIVALLALVCKTLHWPGANIFIWTADIGLFISSTAFLVDGLLEKESRIMGIKIVMAFFTLLFALIVILTRIAG